MIEYYIKNFLLKNYAQSVNDNLVLDPYLKYKWQKNPISDQNLFKFNLFKQLSYPKPLRYVIFTAKQTLFIDTSDLLRKILSPDSLYMLNFMCEQYIFKKRKSIFQI